MKPQFLLLPLCAVLAFASCKRNVTEGHGEVKTETRNVSGFSSIQIGAPLDATITVDSTATASLQLSGYANLLEKITTEVKDGQLIIDKEGLFSFYTDKELTATIVVPSLSALTIKGAADADIKGRLTGDKFKLVVSGAGDVVIESLNTSSFESVLSGAGDLNVNGGSVHLAAYHVRGAGSVEAFALQCKQATAKVSGTGNIEVSVAEKLEADISGAGSVEYKGHPQVQSEIKGVGSVDEVN